MRDSQKSKVYRWQFAVYGRGTPIGFAEAHRIVNSHVTGVTLRLHDGRTHGEAFWRLREIRFPGKGFSRETVLHETAHIITRDKYGFTVQSHGREFVRELMRLLESYGYDRRHMNNAALLTGVRS